MTAFVLLALMTVAVLVLAVLVIYLADRFNMLERQTHDLIRKLQSTEEKPSGPYAGLSGKALWDALTGQETGKLDDLTLDGVRKRYRLLLTEHVSAIFQAGASDVARGMDSPPPNTRMMRTPKAQVESWLPPEAVAEIYRCGQGYGLGNPAELPGLRQQLDVVSAQLHDMCSLEPGVPPSSLLMPPLPGVEVGVPAAGAIAAPEGAAAPASVPAAT